MRQEHNERHNPENTGQKPLRKRVVYTLFNTRVGVGIGGGLVTAAKTIELFDKSPSLHPLELTLAIIGGGFAAYAGYGVRNRNDPER